MHLLKNFIITVSLVTSVTLSEQSPVVADEVPDRCAHAYAAASYRFGAMVSAQIKKILTPDEMTLAVTAIELARGVECPIPQLTKSIDCAVKIAQDQKGEPFEVKQAIICVESAIGKNFPQIKD